MLAPLLLLLLLAATAAADPDCCGNLSHYPRSVSTSYSAGGRTPGRSVETFAFTPEVLERSLLSMGDPADWAKLVASLAARRCVRVLALGGANTCHGGGYWQKLYEPLNARFPCDGSDGRGGGDRAHAVDRLCSPHGGSEHWADFAATALALARDVPPGGERGVGGGVPSAAGGPEHAKLLRADLILVDTSVSDWFLCASDACLAAAYPRAAAHTARWTEVLLHLLRALPQRPALLWVGTASPGAGAAGAVGVWDGATPRRSDGTHAQAAVTRHHGVAHVSPLDSMGPLGGPAAPGDGPRDWFLQAYRRPGDPTGALLSDFAHHLVAEFIAQAVFAHFWEARRGPGAWRTGVGPDGAPRWPAAPPAKSDAERRVEAALAGGARRGGGRGAAAPPQPPRPPPPRPAGAPRPLLHVSEREMAAHTGARGLALDFGRLGRLAAAGASVQARWPLAPRVLATRGWAYEGTAAQEAQQQQRAQQLAAAQAALLQPQQQPHGGRHEAAPLAALPRRRGLLATSPGAEFSLAFTAGELRRHARAPLLRLEAAPAAAAAAPAAGGGGGAPPAAGALSATLWPAREEAGRCVDDGGAGAGGAGVAEPLASLLLQVAPLPHAAAGAAAGAGADDGDAPASAAAVEASFDPLPLPADGCLVLRVRAEAGDPAAGGGGVLLLSLHLF